MTNWKRNITIFLTGQGITLFGSMLVHYAVQWHITLQSKSGVAMMLLSLAVTLPMFFISPFAGVWADRYNKKNIINIADAVIAVVTLIMASLFSLGFEHIALLLVCLMVRGFGQGIQTPTVNSLLPELVPQEQLTRINGINSTIQSIAMFAAPIAGGALIAIAPIQTVLFIDVITAIIGISMLLFFVKTKAVEKKSEPVTAFSDMKEGLRYIGGNTFVLQFMLVGLFFNLLVAPTAILTPLQVVRDFGEESWRLVAIELAFFIGMSLGGLLMGTWGGFKNKSHTMAFATALAGVSIVGLGILDDFNMYLTCMLVAGLVMSIFNAPMMAVLQSKVEPTYMGRVFSVLTMTSSLAMPVSMLVWGPLSDKVAIDQLLIISGIGIAAIGGMFIGSGPLREAGNIQPVLNEFEGE